MPVFLIYGLYQLWKGEEEKEEAKEEEARDWQCRCSNITFDTAHWPVHQDKG